MLMHEYAYYGRGNTNHSPCQIEWSTIHMMTNLIMLELNKSSHFQMDMQLHWNVDLVSCT